MPIEVQARARAAAPLLAPFRSLWTHRHLFRLLLARDIEATFRGSLVGLGWIVVIPLSMVAIYTFVFGFVLKTAWAAPTSGPVDIPLIYFLGLTLFGFWIEVISRAPRLMRENATYVTKVIFPLDVLAFVVVGSALFKLAVNVALLFAFLAVVRGGIPASALLLPLVVAPLALLAVGVAWIFAALGAYFRDLNHAVQAAAPAIMFLSPVFYALAQVPKPLRPVFFANPLAFPLEAARGLVFFDALPTPGGLLAYWAAAGTLFLVGHSVFARLRPGFADVV